MSPRSFLAAVGIFGLMHYSAAQRRREIGLRMALGAQPRGVVVMMMVEGPTLRSYMTAGAPIETAVRLISQVASALDYAHRNGVVHLSIVASGARPAGPGCPCGGA